MKKYAALLFLVLLFALPQGAVSQPRTIERGEMCPLCGMYPARYPRFHCQIVFQDGSHAAFDSAAELLVYLLFPDHVGIQARPLANIYFKDYNREEWIEGGKTYFVVGTEILGPMGIEFLPVDSREAAVELHRQEQGQDIVPFAEITREYMIKAAKAGRLHLFAKELVLQ